MPGRFKTDRWLLLAMGLALFLLGLFIWQSIAAARAHLAVSQQVLSDYAFLAAENFERQAKSSMGYWLVHRVGEAIGREPAELPNRLEDTRRSLATLPANQRKHLAAALETIEGLWFIDQTGAFRCLVGACPELDLARVKQQASGSFGPAGFRVIHRTTPAGPRFTALYPRANGAGVIGAEYDPLALDRWFDEIVAGDLIPAALSRRGQRPGLHVTLRSPEGQLLYETGGPSDPYLQGLRTIGDDYGALLAGFQVRVGLPESMAPTLIIGGLPRSRLPVLLLLVLLTAGVMVGLFRVLWRERQLSRTRNDFVAQVSHELRTPLTQIRMFAETLLLGRERDPDTAALYLRIIDREARRLGHLVDNVLLFSRQERTGSPELTLETLRIAPLLEEIVAGFRPVAKGAGARVELSVRGDPVARIESEAFRQILLNLLDNACKYGHEGQTIEVTAEQQGDSCEITVCDQGPGIPDKDRARVWEAFERLDRSTERNQPGPGIGLAVTGRLLEAMAASCDIEGAPSDGARFRLKFKAGSTADEKAHTAG